MSKDEFVDMIMRNKEKLKNYDGIEEVTQNWLKALDAIKPN